ncbi:hypothetical protein [Melittangium boletus]|uniref:PKD domain-containing protein n=1 Tax=Melittangium boletus DSM 14713 TaxID=1294270 RepID=A0A250I7Q8_9BACT|nr:hypothetical protein [Melittangium boletus]ATB27228.1 PKD domain-containing protein [Melittangium boletus DSM 14713]
MMGSKTRMGWAASMLVACFLSGCEHDTPPPPATPVESGAPEAPFDVQKIMERVHFAFRAEGSAWRGGHDTYAVRADALGLSVTPYHYPKSSSPEHAESAREAPPAAVEGAPVHLGAARVSRGGEVLSGLAGSGRVEDSGELSIPRGEVVERLRNGADGVEQSWHFERRPAGTEALEVRVPVEGGHFLGETDSGLHFAEGATGVGVRYGHGTWVDARGERTPVPARFEGDAIVLRVPASVVDASAYPAVLDPIVSPEFGMDAPVSAYTDHSQDAPVVTHDGTNFLVVWQDFRHVGYTDLYGARVTGSGTLLDPTGLRISSGTNSAYAPAVAHDGTNFLVVWYEWANRYNIHATRVSSTGVVLDPGGIVISNAPGDKHAPAVAHDGTNFLVVWQDKRTGTHDIYGARVDSAGTVLDPNGIAISTAANEQLAPSVAHNGTNFLVVWQDARSGVFDIYGARVNGSGTVLNTNGFLISVAVNAQERPSVAYNGSDFVVVWEDSRNGNADIYGARVSATGVVRNPSGIAISTHGNNQRAPRVARLGTDCLVVWHDTQASKIFGARLSNTGAVLNPSDLLIAPIFSYFEHVSLASDGTNFLVVWGGESSAGRNSDIHATRVTSAGVPLDTPALVLSVAGNGQYTPVVAHDGTNFLVVWRDHRHTGMDIYAVRVSETGTVLDSSGIRLSSSNTYLAFDPAVAHDGTNFLVVWQQYFVNSSVGIRGVRVSSTGSVVDTTPIVLTNQQTYLGRPAVAHDGTNFLVVWEDNRHAVGSNIYGTRVSSAGTVLDTSGIAISTSATFQVHPKVAHNGTNFLVVWQDNRNADNDIYGARVSSTGTVLDTSGIAISTATGNQEHPALTHNGMHFMVVWEDWRVGRSEIYGARVSSAGTVVDTSGIAIATLAMPTQDYKYVPTVTHDGDSFLVAWEDHRTDLYLGDIYGARVSDTGTLLDTQSFVLAAGPLGESTPALTSMGGQSSLLVYRGTDLSATTNSERVKARLVQTP